MVFIGGWTLAWIGWTAGIVVGADTSPREPARPEVFAHYYTWWAGNRPEYPLMPQIGWYAHRLDASGRPDPPNLFLRHIAQARGAGLAGFSFEWMGQHCPETRLIANGFVPANNSLPQRRRIKYLLCFDTTIWAMEYKKLIKAWYEPIPFSDSIAEAFAEEMAFVCHEWPRLDPEFKTNYVHIDGRPAVFVYNAHNFDGQWQQAIDMAREACRPTGGVYLIGDFEVSPHPMFDQRRKEDYPTKASFYDATSNYTLFSGHTFMSLYEYIETGQLDEAFRNGHLLGKASKSGQYYPGIITQYFKSRPAEGDTPRPGRATGIAQARNFVTDGSAGLVPVYKPGNEETRSAMINNSRCTLQLLLAKTFQIQPQIVFITSWNEPYEGTMIEPSRTPNPVGYVMGNDFLSFIDHYLSNASAPAGDLDLNGRIDAREQEILKACGEADRKSPCCLVNELKPLSTR